MVGKVGMVHAGEKLHLNCTATGIPKPDISWYRNKKKLQKSKNSRNFALEMRFYTKSLSDIPMSRTIFFFWIGEYGHSQFIKTTKDDTVISSLQIVPMKHKDDPVRYTCAANNSQGLQRDSVLINIISKNVRKFH